MKRLVTIAFALAFAPIVLDQATVDQVLQAAHQNMRGTEYDWFVSLFKQLEQNAQQSEAAKVAKPEGGPTSARTPAQPTDKK